jgi:hypothetical protein
MADLYSTSTQHTSRWVHVCGCASESPGHGHAASAAGQAYTDRLVASLGCATSYQPPPHKRHQRALKERCTPTTQSAGVPSIPCVCIPSGITHCKKEHKVSKQDKYPQRRHPTDNAKQPFTAQHRQLGSSSTRCTAHHHSTYTSRKLSCASQTITHHVSLLPAMHWHALCPKQLFHNSRNTTS